jgi:mRNA interferase MazF
MRAYQWAVMQATLDPGAESEQKGMRPVLIVSNEEFNQALSNVTVLPLTSTRRNLYPAEVFLPSGIAGQPSDSIIMAHQIRTISKKRLTDLFGYLEDVELQRAVREAIKEHFGLD